MNVQKHGVQRVSERGSRSGSVQSLRCVRFGSASAGDVYSKAVGRTQASAGAKGLGRSHDVTARSLSLVIQTGILSADWQK